MKKNDSPEKILELLKNARNIALFTHSRPDGDAIGSTLALKSALERMGKKLSRFAIPKSVISTILWVSASFFRTLRAEISICM